MKTNTASCLPSATNSCKSKLAVFGYNNAHCRTGTRPLGVARNFVWRGLRIETLKASRGEGHEEGVSPSPTDFGSAEVL